MHAKNKANENLRRSTMILVFIMASMDKYYIPQIGPVFNLFEK
jgi:hypothetical protein